MDAKERPGAGGQTANYYKVLADCVGKEVEVLMPSKTVFTGKIVAINVNQTNLIIEDNVTKKLLLFRNNWDVAMIKR